jgi:hypothetical protein
VVNGLPYGRRDAGTDKPVFKESQVGGYGREAVFFCAADGDGVCPGRTRPPFGA